MRIEWIEQPIVFMTWIVPLEVFVIGPIRSQSDETTLLTWKRVVVNQAKPVQRENKLAHDLKLERHDDRTKVKRLFKVNEVSESLGSLERGPGCKAHRMKTDDLNGDRFRERFVIVMLALCLPRESLEAKVV